MGKKKMIKGLILLLCAVLVLGGAWMFLMKDQKVAYTEETARTRDIETYYTFSGNIESNGARLYTPTVRGTIKEWLVNEGDEVTTDDAVVVYQNGTRIKSPMDGTISDIYVEEGEEFNLGETLFRVADYAHPKVFIRVDEYDVGALEKNMDVDVKVLSTGKVVNGKIVRIAQEATVSGDLAYYPVEIDVEQDGSLAMGLSVEVAVSRENVENATTVSMDAIQYDEDNRPFVYCYDRNNKIVEQRVILGANDGSIIEVKDGVKSGETILIPPSSLLFPMMGR